MDDKKLLKLFKRQDEVNAHLFVLLNIISMETDFLNDKIDKLVYEIHKFEWDITELENRIRKIEEKVE